MMRAVGSEGQVWEQRGGGSRGVGWDPRCMRVGVGAEGWDGIPAACMHAAGAHRSALIEAASLARAQWVPSRWGRVAALLCCNLMRDSSRRETATSPRGTACGTAPPPPHAHPSGPLTHTGLPPPLIPYHAGEWTTQLCTGPRAMEARVHAKWSTHLQEILPNGLASSPLNGPLTCRKSAPTDLACSATELRVSNSLRQGGGERALSGREGGGGHSHPELRVSNKPRLIRGESGVKGGGSRV